jgi:uncharacterized protein (DUF1778 family)
MANTSSTKDSRIDLRVTQAQKELLEAAAHLRGISLSAYTIAEREKLMLTERDRELFMSALENPPKLQGKLKSAIEKYQNKYG